MQQLTEKWIKEKLYNTAISIDDEALLERCIEEYSDYLLSIVIQSGRVEKFIRNFFKGFPDSHRDMFIAAVLKYQDDPEELKYVMTDIIYTLHWTKSFDTTKKMVQQKYL